MHDGGGCSSRPPLVHVGLRVRSISGEPTRSLYPASRPTSFIRIAAAAAAAVAAARRKRLEKGRETKHGRLPLDCIEIKVTVRRCPQENDITRQRAAYSNTVFFSFLLILNSFTFCRMQYIMLGTRQCSAIELQWKPWSPYWGITVMISVSFIVLFSSGCAKKITLSTIRENGQA